MWLGCEKGVFQTAENSHNSELIKTGCRVRLEGEVGGPGNVE